MEDDVTNIFAKSRFLEKSGKIMAKCESFQNEGNADFTLINLKPPKNYYESISVIKSMEIDKYLMKIEESKNMI